MTKRLLIMRHAKSSHAVSGITDHQRRLNKRGRHDAPRMAQFVADQDSLPALILSSTAKRAMETAELFADQCSKVKQPKIIAVDKFYHGHPDEYLSQLRSLQDADRTAMVVGHNPGLEQLVFQLGCGYEPMPTAAIAVFDFAIDVWSQINRKPGQATLVGVWRPREI